MNSNNWIVKYEPLHTIKLFSWKLYYFKTINLNNIEKALESQKFLKLKDNIINVSSIESIYPASNDINQVETKLVDLSKERADRIREQVYMWKEKNPQKTLNEAILKNIIDTYK